MYIVSQKKDGRMSNQKKAWEWRLCGKDCQGMGSDLKWQPAREGNASAFTTCWCCEYQGSLPDPCKALQAPSWALLYNLGQSEWKRVTLG